MEGSNSSPRLGYYYLYEVIPGEFTLPKDKNRVTIGASIVHDFFGTNNPQPPVVTKTLASAASIRLRKAPGVSLPRVRS